MEVLFTGYIFYNNSVDAAGAAKLAALYILANTDVTVDHITKAGRPWWGSSLTSTSGLTRTRWRSTLLGDSVNGT